MPENETPADRLRTGASRVRRGWRTGSLLDEQGNRCAIGALLNVTPERIIRSGSTGDLLAADPVAFSATVALNGYLRSTDGPHRTKMVFRMGETISNVMTWNDVVPTSGAEVAEVMEKAAAKWEEFPDATA